MWGSLGAALGRSDTTGAGNEWWAAIEAMGRSDGYLLRRRDTCKIFYSGAQLREHEVPGHPLPRVIAGG